MEHRWLGEGRAYDEVLALQNALHACRAAGEVGDVLLTLTHAPVYTAGRHADLARNVTGERPDIPVVRADRGGDVTYHGPGQVVAYPIVRLRDRGAVRAYVGALEAACLHAAATFGVRASRRDGYPGAWVGEDKLAAVGVRISGGVTKHGLAFNVAPDLADFAGIVPCGITAGGVCSLASLGVRASVPQIRDTLVRALGQELAPLTDVHS